VHHSIPAALIFAFATLNPLVAFGQTALVDPRAAEFTASTSHNATDANGNPLLTGYTLEFYLAGAASPFQTQPLGKPTPDATGLIHIDFATTLTAFPAPGVVYESRVAAVGPGGTTRSNVSNQFQFSDPCAAAAVLTPLSASVSAGAGTGSVAVTKTAGCSWTAASNATWLSVTAGATGTGSGTVSYSFAANSTISARTGTLTIAGQTFSVTQAGTSCTFTISPTSLSAQAAGTNGSITVTTLPGCTWTSSSGATWATITAGASGTGSGTVNYSIAANPAGISRSTTLTVAGQTFSVTQAGAGCTFTISPTSVTVPAGGTTSSLAVTTLDGCSWTAIVAPGATWVTITAGSAGTGNGTVAYSVAPNTATTTRTATITVGGKTLSITQDSAPCTFTVAPLTTTVAATGGTTTFNISTAAGCTWTASSNQTWVTFPSGQTGTGTGTVTAQVAANTANTSRTATLTIGGIAVTVTQQASAMPLPPTNLKIIR
jgi:hypothetical protein